MTSRKLVLALALALAAAPVSSAFAGEPPKLERDPQDTWQTLSEDPEQEVARREYDRAMLEGDNNLDFAVAEVVASRRQKFVENAIRAYELASRARPDSPEPHFRAAAALHAFYIDCNVQEGAALCRDTVTLSVAARKQADRVIRHWNAFEAKAPRDPRLADEILFERAILHTKLATPEHLALALADYKKLIARINSRQSRHGQLAAGNLPETEMMLGDLDSAIVNYRRALEINQPLPLYFGLAVALDRDEQGSAARSLLRTFGIAGLREFEDDIAKQDVFYVPDGEAYYYLALGYEAIGIDDAAIRYYDLFLASGAHPQYAPRARANRAAIAERRSKRPPYKREQDDRYNGPTP